MAGLAASTMACGPSPASRTATVRPGTLSMARCQSRLPGRSTSAT